MMAMTLLNEKYPLHDFKQSKGRLSTCCNIAGQEKRT